MNMYYTYLPINLQKLEQVGRFVTHLPYSSVASVVLTLCLWLTLTHTLRHFPRYLCVKVGWSLQIDFLLFAVSPHDAFIARRYITSVFYVVYSNSTFMWCVLSCILSCLLLLLLTLLSTSVLLHLVEMEVS